uniref:Uncharacterized protein n=2 Tax=Poecilia TaxID=8080 RepID=A0A3B3UQ85_9TELE
KGKKRKNNHSFLRNINFASNVPFLKEYLVFTDILKHFNHNVTGYSLGVGDQNNPQAFLNQAVPVNSFSLFMFFSPEYQL